MKILYINTAYYGGGSEKVARQLYCGIKRTYNVDTYFTAGKTKKTKEVEVIYGNRLLSKIINEIVSRIFPGIRIRDVYSRNRILSIIKREGIDIIHFHNLHGDFIGLEDVKFLAKHCKIVWTLHDMWAVTGHCAYPMQCDSWWKDNCMKCNDLALYPPIRFDLANELLLKKQTSFIDNNIRFVVPSKWLYGELKKTYLADENVRVIENGVNLEQYIVMDKVALREKMHIPLNKTVLIFSATDVASPYKGADVLLEALKKLPNKEKYFLIVVGRGNISENLSQLEYIQTGVIKEETVMNEYMSAADVFIIPSKAENFPCSVLESMASGTPVLGSAVGGIVEQIDDETGWLFQNGNAIDLCNKLIEIQSNQELLYYKSKRCRKKVEDFFSENKMLQSYFELYEELARLSIEDR